MSTNPAAAHRTLTKREHQVKERILTQVEPSRLAGSHSGIVLKETELFFLTDTAGDVPWNLPHAFGLYYRDTRFLDGFTFLINGQPAVALPLQAPAGDMAVAYLVNPGLRDGSQDVPQHVIAIRRERRVHGGVVHERLQLSNHWNRRVSLCLELRFRCQFDDIFIVKQFVEGPRGRIHEPEVREGAEVVHAYHGIDAVRREMHILFEPAPRALSGEAAVFDVTLEPAESGSLSLAMTPVIDHRRRAGRPRRIEEIDTRISQTDRVWLNGTTELHSSNVLFDHVLQRALLDLRLLRSRIGRHRYFAAGVPWFGTLFGRDAAIVALQTLPYAASFGRDTLALLSRYQANSTDSYRDAEPGKILHELRRGELAAADEIPQSPAYYGTVDATLLFIILFAQYVRWSGDLSLAAELRSNLSAALDWIDRAAARNRDGYLVYDHRYPNGLINEGWKDSGNAIVSRDGGLAEPPIALAEVQAYMFRAYEEAAFLLEKLEGPEHAQRLRARAARLRQRFHQDFWSDAIGCYMLARQHAWRPADVVASNAGQVLWSGIASEEHARSVVRRLLEPDMFSGWGIRTLSSREYRYNPVSYHLGSVWPHDNALIISGFKRYGHHEAAGRLFESLFDAAVEFRGRLPELFCGFPRLVNEPPVPYPAACSPQAWAAGSLPHALWNLLGLEPNALDRTLFIRQPVLPRGLDWLTLSGLRVADAEVDLRFRRGGDQATAVEVEARRGRLDVRVLA